MLDTIDESLDGWGQAGEGFGALVDYTVDAVKDGDASRVFTALAAWNQARNETAKETGIATAKAAGGLAWGILSTPYQLVTQSIPNFFRAGRERMEGKDRGWDVVLTGTMLAGDVTPLYGVGRATGATTRINTAARRTVSPLYRSPAVVASNRATTLQNALTPRTSRSVTISAAVVEDSSGARFLAVGSSAPNYIRPGVKAVMGPDEVIVPGAAHAEENIVRWATETDNQVIAIAAGRPICPSCSEMMNTVQATIASALK